MHPLPHSVPRTLQQATTDPRLCWRLLDTHRQIWVSLLWGHCSFLLGPGAQGSVVPSKSLFCQSCVSSGGSMVGLMATSSKRAYAIIQVCCTQSHCPCDRPLLTCTFTGDSQTQFWLSLCGGSGSWCTQGLFEPSEHLWRKWSLILNLNLHLPPSFWSFSDLGCGVCPHGCSMPYSRHSSAAARKFKST